ncbi:MAG: hypothetical protein ACLQVI_30850, partial [Polyangiaceae bacterium]
ACSVGSQGVAGETEAGAPDATVVTDATASEDGGGSDATIGADSGLSADTGLADAPSDSQGQADTAPTVYCATTGTYDGGEAGALPDPSPQIFGPNMAGCPGVVYWAQRASLCSAACTPCSASQWVALHGTTPPAYDYWTNDDLGYSGEFEQGEACLASPLDAGPDAAAPYECESADSGPVPMRVCRPDPTVAPFTYGQFDPLGNECNWVRCAYGTDASVPDAGPDAGPDAAPPVFDFMGGCDGDLTAGTLCCCP